LSLTRSDGTRGQLHDNKTRETLVLNSNPQEAVHEQRFGQTIVNDRHLTSLVLFIDLRASKQDNSAWTSDFSDDRSELSPTGHNALLHPGASYSLVLIEEMNNSSSPFLEKRKGSITSRRACRGTRDESRKLVEVSRNFFAISKRTNNVYYFGEEVDMYKRGKITSHEGCLDGRRRRRQIWLDNAGTGAPESEVTFRSFAPKVAMDRAEIVSLNEMLKVPAGAFNDCLKIEETTPLERGVKEYKYYASGIGLIQDGKLKLVRYGKAN